MWRKIPLKLSVFICLLCVVLSGCGKKENIHELGIDGFVYVAEQVELQDIPADNFRVRDGYLYYRFGDYGSGTDLRRFPIEELLSGNVQKLPAGESLFAAGSRPDYIVDYTIDREGWIYCLEERRDAKEVPLMRPLEGMDGYMLDETEISYVLVKRRPDGEEGYCVSLADTPRCLAAGEQGMVYVAAIDSIYAVDGEGRMLDRIALDADTAGELLEGEGGSVYYDPMNGGNEIYEIDASDSFRLQRMEGPCTMGGSFAGSGDGLLYSGNDGLLYRCGRDAVSWKPVLRWGDSSLSVRGVAGRYSRFRKTGWG